MSCITGDQVAQPNACIPLGSPSQEPPCHLRRRAAAHRHPWPAGALLLTTPHPLARRAITVGYAFKKDTKGERHGTPAERLLAEQQRTKAASASRPHTLFASGPRQRPSGGAAGAPDVRTPPWVSRAFLSC